MCELSKKEAKLVVTFVLLISKMNTFLMHHMKKMLKNILLQYILVFHYTFPNINIKYSILELQTKEKSMTKIKNPIKSLHEIYFGHCETSVP